MPVTKQKKMWRIFLNTAKEVEANRKVEEANRKVEEVKQTMERLRICHITAICRP